MITTASGAFSLSGPRSSSPVVSGSWKSRRIRSISSEHRASAALPEDAESGAFETQVKGFPQLIVVVHDEDGGLHGVLPATNLPESGSRGQWLEACDHGRSVRVTEG
jgi:hypothetical protein